MFKLFRKKTQIEALIANDGMDRATDHFSQIITAKLGTRDVAYRFMLQELDGASQGNESSQLFAKNSGIAPAQYRGALNYSSPEVDAPQQVLLELSLQISNQELMAEFRCKVDEKIMQRFDLGKHAKTQDRVESLYDSLNEVLLSDNKIIPALTPNIAVPDNARVRHVNYRYANIAAAQELISALEELTGDDTESTIRRALKKIATGSSPSGNWIDTLRTWADDVGLKELKWEVQTRNRDGGFWTGFPRDPKKIAELESLDIQEFGLTELPNEIVNLIHLRKIWARGNSLTAIPEEIGNMVNLEEMDFEGNKLTRVPESIGKLKRLRVLDLRANQLNFVPSSVRNLVSLEKFDLRDQPIKLGHINTPLSDEQVEAICSLGDVVRW